MGCLLLGFFPTANTCGLMNLPSGGGGKVNHEGENSEKCVCRPCGGSLAAFEGHLESACGFAPEHAHQGLPPPGVCSGVHRCHREGSLVSHERSSGSRTSVRGPVWPDRPSSRGLQASASLTWASHVITLNLCVLSTHRACECVASWSPQEY